jgi:DNA repair exonuclease SbcCD ATPase subunit
VEQNVEELATRRDTTLSALEQEGGELEEKLEALQQRVGELQEAASQGADQATSALEGLLTAAQGVGQALPAAWSQVEDSLESLETEIDTQVQAVAAGFEDSLATQIASFQALGEKLVEEHNQAVEKFVTRYTEQAFEELETAVQPLTDAMTALETLCQEQQETLASRMGEVTDKLTAVAGLLERVRPALQLAGRLR